MGRSLLMEADGGSRGNPGVAGYGALVRDAETGELLAERAEPLGKASNNVAEYSGLIAGLEAAAEIDPGADVDVAMDSKLVVEQMAGRWKIKHPDMRQLALRARDLAAGFADHGGSVTYRWIPRAQNGDADLLSNVAMDGESVRRGPGLGTTQTSAPLPVATPEPAALDLDPVAQPSPLAPAALGPDGPATRTGATRIVLVRHGATAFTQESRLDGRGGADPSLTPDGVVQAERAGALVAHLLDGASARVVTSSLTRARQTGARVAEAIEVEAVADERWDEQAYGDWDGRSLAELAREVPAELALLRSDPAYARPGGESQQAVAARVIEAYESLVAAGGTAVVVCHRTPIMVVLGHLLGLSPERARRIAAAPGSLTAIEAWPDGRASLVFTNRR